MKCKWYRPKTVHDVVFVSCTTYHTNGYHIFSGSGRLSGLYEYEHSEHEYDEHEYEYKYNQQRGASTKWRCDGCRGQNEH